MSKATGIIFVLGALLSGTALAGQNRSGGGSGNGNGGPDTTQQVIVLKVDCREKCEPDPFDLHRRKFNAARPLKSTDLPDDEMVFIDFENKPPISRAISTEYAYLSMAQHRRGSLIYLNKRGYFMTAGSMLLYSGSLSMRHRDGTISQQGAQEWVDRFVKPGVQDLQGLDGEERVYHREKETDNYLVASGDYVADGYSRSTIRITTDGELIVKKEFCFNRRRNEWVEYGYLIANLKQGLVLKPR
ncbi:MAG TPA: hypothetical protein VM598_11945 [Bdellovibrionota bacterium]|nr:hypothetical protein [Bdellovibrionota bacterium]